MQPIKQRILNYFQNNQEKETSTSTIVQLLYPQDYTQAQEVLKSPLSSTQQQKQAKQQLAKLHRKVLYHLSSLVEEKKLLVTRTSEKGHKYFALLHVPAMQSYANNHCYYEFQRFCAKQKIEIVGNTFPNTTFNCVLINGNQLQNKQHLLRLITPLGTMVNDLIALDHAEQVLVNPETFLELINQISEDIMLNLSVDCTKPAGYDALKVLLANPYPQNCILILKTTPKLLHQEQQIFKDVFNALFKKKLSFAVHNCVRDDSPSFLGKYGPYRLDKKKWELSLHKQAAVLLIPSYLSVRISLQQILLHHTYSQVREWMLTLAHHLFKVNYSLYHMQHSHEFFFRENYPHSIETNLISSNYLRLILSENDANQSAFLQQLHSEIDSFIRKERAIYKSCGMPFLFHITLAVENTKSIDLASASIKNIQEKHLLHASAYKTGLSYCYAPTYYSSTYLNAESLYSTINWLVRALPFHLHYFKGGPQEKNRPLTYYLGEVI
ncbi:MAG: hypothetical protein QW594_03340 [Candidatus Woesearchaeota archaeon]